jgi:hypothetical protein
MSYPPITVLPPHYRGGQDYGIVVVLDGKRLTFIAYPEHRRGSVTLRALTEWLGRAFGTPRSQEFQIYIIG